MLAQYKNQTIDFSNASAYCQKMRWDLAVRERNLRIIAAKVELAIQAKWPYDMLKYNLFVGNPYMTTEMLDIYLRYIYRCYGFSIHALYSDTRRILELHTVDASKLPRDIPDWLWSPLLGTKWHELAMQKITGSYRMINMLRPTIYINGESLMHEAWDRYNLVINSSGQFEINKRRFQIRLFLEPAAFVVAFARRRELKLPATAWTTTKNFIISSDPNWRGVENLSEAHTWILLDLLDTWGLRQSPGNRMVRIIRATAHPKIALHLDASLIRPSNLDAHLLNCDSAAVAWALAEAGRRTVIMSDSDANYDFLWRQNLHRGGHPRISLAPFYVRPEPRTYLRERTQLVRFGCLLARGPSLCAFTGLDSELSADLIDRCF